MYIIDKLENGIKVVMERIDHVNSVTIGVIVENGSIREDHSNNGVSHFIEHMLFKGTVNRTPKEIAESIDDIGGQINAFTGKEQTCYFAKVLDQHLPIAIDVLSDMLNNSLFLPEDIVKEKGVILEEINMYQDAPEDLVFELLNDLMFEGTSLELPILGSIESMSNLNRETIIDYFYKNYNPNNMIISLAGKFNSKEVMKQLNEGFGSFNLGIRDPLNKIKTSHKYTNKIAGIRKNIEQLNICLGLEAVNNTSDDVQPILVMNNIFGGSMSSRLFQKIREERGLVYAIDSHLSTYDNVGDLTIYAGLNSDYLTQVMDLVKIEMDYMKKNLISKDELRKSKEQLKGSYILGMEGTFNRMFEIGKSMSLIGRIESPKEVIDKIDAVTMDDIHRVVNMIFDESKLNIAYVGELEDENKTENELKDIFEMRCNDDSEDNK